MIQNVGRPRRDRKTHTVLLETKTTRSNTKSTLDGIRAIKHAEERDWYS